LQKLKSFPPAKRVMKQIKQEVHNIKTRREKKDLLDDETHTWDSCNCHSTKNSNP
jgi:hypothetical protein